MIGRWRDRATSALERFLLQGPLARLAFIACLLLLLTFGAGLLAWEVAGPFDSPWSAIWWAFLRLSDPGYLGDDAGGPRRVIGTALIVLGYVLFLGALVAIMTQWLNATIARLQLGLTPIARNGHVVILGWSNLTPIIVRELLWSEERVERFLLLRGARRLHVGILADEVTPEHRQELRDRLGEVGDAETLELVGPEVLNGEATAAAWQRHLGRPVRYAGDDLEAWAAGARTMLPERLVHDFAIMYRYFQERGWAAPPGAVARLTALLGRPPRSFDDYASQTAAEWRAG